jgi:Protein of unknown function (DUF3142)
MMWRRLALAGALLVTLSAGCNRAKTGAPARLPQRGYLWQREWTPAVVHSIAQAQKRMNGLVILGAEIVWDGKTPHAIKATIDWAALRKVAVPCSVALRIAPFAGPFSTHDASIRFITDTAKSLLDEFHAHGVTLSEFQVDFDCAQRSLAGYRIWLRVLRPAIHPLRFVITTLPTWLDEPEFTNLIRHVDGYVLQVHSVSTRQESGRTVLCDNKLARKWVQKAARLGVPFSVSLPTYRCIGGYDGTGKLIGVAMDSVQPTWPPGTRVLEFSADEDALAQLVEEWEKARPPELRELIWFRLPVATDARNWRWPTLSAVMAGRKPVHKLEVSVEGENPLDFSITNTGEADEQRNPAVAVRWSNGSLMASDALPGWTLQTGTQRALFTPTSRYRFRLPPGAKRNIGWLRYDRPTSVQAQVEESDEAHP